MVQKLARNGHLTDPISTNAQMLSWLVSNEWMSATCFCLNPVRTICDGDSSFDGN